MIRPLFFITHAAFSDVRRAALRRLMDQLRREAPTLPVVIAEDTERRGSMWCWRRAIDLGLASDHNATHLVWLPDDAIVCRDYGRILRACIEARPDDIWDAFVNHALLDPSKPEHLALNTLWYSTPDGGFTGLGGVFPRERIVEHLAWRERVGLPDSYTNDGGVNLEAIHTGHEGRRIYKTRWSLVTHDTSLPSLEGRDDDAMRGGLCPVDEARVGILEDVEAFVGRTYGANDEVTPGMRTSTAMLPRTYNGNQWAIARELRPEHWQLERMYACARNDEPIVTPSLLILAPTYRMPQELVEKTRASVMQVRADLEQHGIPSDYVELRGDSLICRVRQRGCNLFLQSSCSHLLWWDSDIECMTPDCVRKMIATGHGVITGAVPFKQAGGAVVVNLLPDDVERMARGEPIAIDGGCLEVADAGTGFMLVARETLIRMQYAHPELLHFSLSKSDYGQPLWALFDTKVVDRVYRSEDFYFCHLWRQMGGKVFVYEPGRFKHWGVAPYEGSLMQQYGFEKVT